MGKTTSGLKLQVFVPERERTTGESGIPNHVGAWGWVGGVDRRGKKGGE